MNNNPPADKSISPPPKRIKISGNPPEERKDAGIDCSDLEPIRPTLVQSPTGRWQACQDGHILYRKPPPSPSPPSPSPSSLKVAGFDLGGTLLDSHKTFPSALNDYELWNQNVVTKLRNASNDGYQLMIFINQGGIRGAIKGKTASKVKNLIEWLCSKSIVDRPINAFVSTMKKSGCHKPSSKMWEAAEQILECSFDKESSFFVGDSVDFEQNGNVTQGDDDNFARNIGPIQFYTPMEYFGPSHRQSRESKRVTGKQAEYELPSEEALKTRAALQSGYLKSGILIVLCGPQGAGKSFFCSKLIANLGEQWVHLSQDTIRNGKPGPREAVERAAIEALTNKKNVVVDRMHLDELQRSHFVNIAKDANVCVHAVALTAPKSVVTERVLTRTHHPGNVQGESGARLASASWSNFIMPKYQEGFDLICAAGTVEGVQSIVKLYRRVGKEPQLGIQTSYSLPGNIRIPSIVLGTFKIGKRTAADIVSTAAKLGIDAVDTAPTYNNETQVGLGTNENTFIQAKVPKRATTAAQVKEELQNTLKNLNRKKVDLLLLHWPCDAITSDSLKEVWNAMEEAVKEGYTNSLGVCNFNVESLRLLLPHCTTTRPVVNQVERHPLLPQWQLVDFCFQQGILVQAHSPLGQGELLKHDTVKLVSDRSGLSLAQVLVQWNLCQQCGVVTKCSSRDHIMDVVGGAKTTKFLTTQDMITLNSVGETKRFVSPPFMFGNGSFCWAMRK